MAAPLNVALVGFGYAGRTFHAPLISACEGLNLHTVVTRQAEALAGAWPNARAVSSLDDALADPAIGLVVIATPNALHAPQAKAALEAGKAVVIDKPFALDLAEAREVAALAEARGLLLTVFHNRRWDADFLALKAELAAGRLGPIRAVESHFDRHRPEVRDRWRERDEPGSGIWHDLGPHLIDQMLVLFGRPLAVTCNLAILREGGQAIDWAHAVLRYADKRVILHADMTTPAPEVRFAVHGASAAWLKSGLDVQEDQLKTGVAVRGPGWGVDPSPAVRVHGATGAREPVPGPPGDYLAFYDAVAAALRGEGSNPVPPDEALAVMEVLEAGIESSRRRAEVALAPPGG
ncbi:oxidoreductase [Roseibacterium beibuensis]|uniref:oxidoreductase n=1 Tax=[Roseibacterium] beibuensis TaxID=1193142 RepID=UPI00217D6F1B|nr:oxidoreductase [Roseibacterium beibuensis]MCS6627505.1 oxidoreductase [Roseibacterium beibuensis]